MKVPDWLPEPTSILIAVLAGGAIGLIEGRRDERRRRIAAESEVWEEAIIPESVESSRSGNAGSDQANGSTADSGISMPDVSSMALHEQIPNKESE